MSCGSDEVQADVDASVVVVEEGALNLQLLLKVVLKLCVDVVHDGLITAKGGKTRILSITPKKIQHAAVSKMSLSSVSNGKMIC